VEPGMIVAMSAGNNDCACSLEVRVSAGVIPVACANSNEERDALNLPGQMCLARSKLHFKLKPAHEVTPLFASPLIGLMLSAFAGDCRWRTVERKIQRVSAHTVHT
jgi:hypothetical protein